MISIFALSEIQGEEMDKILAWAQAGGVVAEHYFVDINEDSKALAKLSGFEVFPVIFKIDSLTAELTKFAEGTEAILALDASTVR